MNNRHIWYFSEVQCSEIGMRCIATNGTILKMWFVRKEELCVSKGQVFQPLMAIEIVISDQKTPMNILLKL